MWVDMSPDERADIEARAVLHGCLTFIIVGAMLLVLMIFGSCTTTKYVTVPEVHEMWHHQTDTIHQTDSIIDRQTMVIREVDSAAMAEYGIQLKDMQRAWLVERFCQPVYETWLAEAVALGRVNAPGFFTDPIIRAAWCKAEWLGPVQGQLDPTKEVKADILAVAHGFKTHEQVTREYGGGDWNENVERLKEENAALKAAGTDAAADADKFNNEPDLDPDMPGGGNNA